MKYSPEATWTIRLGGERVGQVTVRERSISIGGRVYSGKEGKVPLEGARVSISRPPREDRTDDEGRYRLHRLRSRTYTQRFAAEHLAVRRLPEVPWEPQGEKEREEREPYSVILDPEPEQE